MSPPLGSALILSSLLTCLPLLTNAHMQMSWPYPLKSPLDPAVPYYDKDYSMTSPLLADGSDFSCKHYQSTSTYDQANVIKATYYAGNTYNMSITGTAPHNGGSCQLSLSYDNGETFKVIKSMIGGCPVTLTYDFTIPSFAPTSDSVLFSWSWFNLAGNREMYQNCARVKIASNPSQKYRRSVWKRQTSMSQLPDMFVCNVANGCTTIEGSEVVFPDPGNDVVYGQDLVTPTPGPGFTTLGAASSSAATSAAGSGASVTTTSGTGSPVSEIAPTTSAVYVPSTTTGSSLSTTLSTQIPVTTPAQFYNVSTTSTLETTTASPPFALLNGTTTTNGLLSSGTGLPSTTDTKVAIIGEPATSSTTSASSSTASSSSTSSSSNSSTSTSSGLSSSAFVVASSSTSTVSRIGAISTSSSSSSTPSSSSTSSGFTQSTAIAVATSSSSSSGSSTQTSSYITLIAATTSSTTSASSSSSSTPSSSSTSSGFTQSTAIAAVTSSSSSSGSSTQTSSYITLIAATTSSTTSASSSSSSTPSSSSTSSGFTQSTAIAAATTSAATTTSTSATATAQPTTCTPGTFECNSVSTFSQCVATGSTTTTYIYMGSVAAGMQCVNGSIIRQNAGPCTPNGQIFCNGTNAFYMCDQGGLIDMGPVAPGTACRNGVIGFA